MPFNPFKRSQPMAPTADSPASASAGRAHPLERTSHVCQTPFTPSSQSSDDSYAQSRSASSVFDSGCGSTPASSASSTFSPAIRDSQPPSKARHGRLESGGIAFDAVTPVKRASLARKPRSRQTTVTGPVSQAPRQRSHSHFLLQAPPSPRVVRHLQPLSRPRIVRRASSMDDIIASPVSSRPAALFPQGPVKGKLTARAFYKALEVRDEGACNERTTSIAACRSLFGPPANSAANASGFDTPARSPTHSQQPSPVHNPEGRCATGIASPPMSLNKLRVKSSNGLQDRRWPGSPITAYTKRAISPRTNQSRTLTPAEAPGLASLSLKVVAGQGQEERRQLANIISGDDLLITLRGDKTAVKGLEVMLVCIAEGEETVWELRVKHAQVPASSKDSVSGTSPTSSPPTNGRATTPFTAIYTPPCEDLDMYRADYFSAPVPRASLLGASSATLQPTASSPTNCSQAGAHAHLVTTLTDPIKPLAISSKSPGARQRTSSAYHPMSCPVTPRRSRFTSNIVPESKALDDGESTDDGELAARGFSSLYKGLADAYRTAHESNEDQFGLEREFLMSTPAKDMIRDPCPLPSGLVSASLPCSPTTGSSSASLSPENRYALYLPAPLPASPALHSSGTPDLPTPRDLTGSEWDGYSSSIAESYARLDSFASPKTPLSKLQRQAGQRGHAFSSPGPFPTTPSLHNGSVQGSPAATLYQRRIGEGQSPGFQLNLARSLEDHALPHRPLQFGLPAKDAYDIPHGALARLGESRGSIGSISLKGRQGWSETEAEGSSADDTDSDEAAIVSEATKISYFGAKALPEQAAVLA